jgi:hypothetical protein
MELPELVKSYLAFCDIQEESLNKQKIDLSNWSFFYPTTLLPLSDFIGKNRGKFGLIHHENSSVSDYINIILYPSVSEFRKGKSYIPLVSLPLNDVERGSKLLEKIYPVNSDWRSYGGKSAFMELVSELTDNIYNHSCSTMGLVMTQKYDRPGFIEVCVYDNGITIAGSFKEHLKMKVSGLEAIKQAISGTSTKANLERGTGLQNTIKLVKDVFKGEIMIVSGNGLVYTSNSIDEGANLIKESHKLNGTLISIRFPIQEREVRWYDIIK